MNEIKFSHRYVKMPQYVEHLETFIKDVAVIEYKDLTPEQIEQDTAIVGGGNYQLPKGKLIWIKLWTPTVNGAHEWGTMRPYRPWTFEYYKKLRGLPVTITIL